MQYKIIEAPKKFKKWPSPLFRVKTMNNIHAQKLLFATWLSQNCPDALV